MQSWKQCALPVITTMVLWQFMHLGMHIAGTNEPMNLILCSLLIGYIYLSIGYIYLSIYLSIYLYINILYRYRYSLDIYILQSLYLILKRSKTKYVRNFDQQWNELHTQSSSHWRLKWTNQISVYQISNQIKLSNLLIKFSDMVKQNMALLATDELRSTTEDLDIVRIWFSFFSSLNLKSKIYEYFAEEIQSFDFIIKTNWNQFRNILLKKCKAWTL